MNPDEVPFVHQIAVVVPVYQGERTLDRLLGELQSLTVRQPSAKGRRYQVVEVVLVHDNGPDRSDQVIRRLAAQFPFVAPIWLSRNFGQHAATLAGMASTSADWIVTLDEDGQHNPADIPRLLDTALDEQAALVYADATNAAPHGLFRNAASSLTRWMAQIISSHQLGRYSSYRLILGELGRAVAAYGGHDIYLDVALSWVVPRSRTCPTKLRQDIDRPSGYRLRTLLSHFWRLMLTAGTRMLRIVAVVGTALALAGFVLSIFLAYERLARNITVPGWTSVVIAVLILSGVMLFAIGVMAEYLGVAVRMAMGRPPYLIVRDPSVGPLAHAEVAPVQQPLPVK